MSEDRKYWGAGDYAREREREYREGLEVMYEKNRQDAKMNRMAADLAAIRKELEKKNEDQ